MIWRRIGCYDIGPHEQGGIRWGGLVVVEQFVNDEPVMPYPKPKCGRKAKRKTGNNKS